MILIARFDIMLGKNIIFKKGEVSKAWFDGKDMAYFDDPKCHIRVDRIGYYFIIFKGDNGHNS